MTVHHLIPCVICGTPTRLRSLIVGTPQQQAVWQALGWGEPDLPGCLYVPVCCKHNHKGPQLPGRVLLAVLRRVWTACRELREGVDIPLE
ncbi:MAG TPA: hypothetical protein PKK06_13075 [Phycisphaerae bacterium]|nr:hypothetical protein [Phycisphaerae bacterium]HNU44410.1 hypothetical protein [Phycisphaerae bacterium]